MLREKEESIRVKLYNNHPGYKILEKIVQGYTPILVNDIEYESISDFLKTNPEENLDRFKVMRRLNSKIKKWENWRYKYGKKQSGPDKIF